MAGYRWVRLLESTLGEHPALKKLAYRLRLLRVELPDGGPEPGREYYDLPFTLEPGEWRIGMAQVSDDSQHYAYSAQARREIAKRYWHERARIANNDAWAQTEYGITGKTLAEYLKEFPET
jgi:hypothetical protein